MAKIIYFTASRAPTGAELTAIGQLKALAEPRYEIAVRTLYDGTDASYGNDEDGARLEEADYAAGTIPGTGYYHGLPVFDPANPPALDLEPTEAVVKNGVAIPITGGEVTFVVANNEITGGAFVATP